MFDGNVPFNICFSVFTLQLYTLSCTILHLAKCILTLYCIYKQFICYAFVTFACLTPLNTFAVRLLVLLRLDHLDTDSSREGGKAKHLF